MPRVRTRAVLVALGIQLLIAASLPLVRLTGYRAGILVWVLVGLLVGGWTFLLIEALCAVVPSARPTLAAWPKKIGLATASAILVLASFEAFLQLQDWLVEPSGTGDAGALTLPAEWAKRDVEIEGARSAYYWHGVLHVYDENRMRRTAPFPPKRDDTFRIAVVGDSLTYGEGVAEEQAYPSLLQGLLESRYRIEVLNLGIPGSSSEDVREIVARFVPLLDPDLVVYGICQNDFLPHSVGEYASNRAYAFPLPKRFKKFVVRHTRTGQFLNERYDQLLMRAGLRQDFWDDVLEDFEGYQARFARDVEEIDRLVRAAGAPPVRAMVLDQFPDVEGRGRRVTLIAEAIASDAGMDVVDTAEYYARHDGEVLKVSRWEGHPNPQAHALFAEYLRRAIEGDPRLSAFRR